MIEEHVPEGLSPQVLTQKVAEYLKDCSPDGISLESDPMSARWEGSWWQVRVHPSKEPPQLARYFAALASVEAALEEREHLKVFLAPGEPKQPPSPEAEIPSVIAPRKSRARPGHPIGLDPLTLLGFLGPAVVCWCLALYVFYFREEWQARPGLMTMRKRLCRFRQVRDFRDGELTIQQDPTVKRYPQWRLSVKARRAACTFDFVPLSRGDWRLTEVGTLAQVLAEATGFPLKDEQGVAHHIGSRMTSAGAGVVITVKALQTGQVLVRVPGGTLVGSNLAGARLEGADLRGADLRRADLQGTDLQGADLGGADAQGADLRGAILKGANLMKAQLRGALLTGADLSDADLTGAGLTGATLMGATYSAGTRWPAGFDPRQHKAVLAE